MNPGIYPNISNDAYHSGAGVSKSQLDKIARSPLHYKYSKENPQEQTEAMRIGTATHTAILEPHLFFDNVAVAPVCDRRTRAGKVVWEEFCAESAGKTIITQEQADDIHGMCDAVNAHPYAPGFLRHGIAEQSAYWVDEETGILCRCRPDYQRGNYLVDLKTTDDASPRAFMRSAMKYRYHVQSAFYSDGMEACGVDVHGFVFVVVEKKPPYAVAVYEAGPDFIEKGRAEYRANLETLKRCQVENKWPAYDEPMILEWPEWAL